MININNKELFTKETLDHTKFNFRCPHCRSGIIFKEKGDENEKNEIKINVKESPTQISGYVSYYEKVFASKFLCLHCKDAVIIIYHEFAKLFYDNIIYNGLPAKYPDYKKTFTIKSIYPFVPIIETPRDVPEELNELINSSFSLFWIDLKSCANRIRSALELLLDAYNIEGKKLYDRIKKLKTKKPELEPYMNAIRLVGNIGSHSKGEVNREKVITIYELLSFLLNDKFSNEEKTLLDKANEIIKNDK